MKKRGISLIVLVITIIVIVILGTAVIVTFVKNNPIENAKNATNKWNQKTLEEKANMLETELLLEFQEVGLGGMVLPSYAKEAYMNALKEGKTEEEAKQIAMDSFIGSYYDWCLMNDKEIYPLFDNVVDYTPMYKEVTRVRKDITRDKGQGLIELNIDTSVVPEDLVTCLNNYYEQYVKYKQGNITKEEYDAFYINNEPLRGLIAKDSNNKYFFEIAQATVPYYVYDVKGKIIKVRDCKWTNMYIGNYGNLSPYDITVLKFDENYKELNETESNIFYLFDNPNCKVIFPSSLKRINKNALEWVWQTKLEIPNTIEYIDPEAFGKEYCDLTELIIKKEKGSIPGEPWGLDPTQTTIKWEP